MKITYIVQERAGIDWIDIAKFYSRAPMEFYMKLLKKEGVGMDEIRVFCETTNVDNTLIIPPGGEG